MKWFEKSEDKEKMSEDEVKDSADQDPSQPTQDAESGEVEKLKMELAEARDKSTRLLAEFENMRKRHERDRQELIKYAHEEVIVELLGFYEDFERSLAAAKASPHDTATIVKGLEMVMNRFQQFLKTYEVREIEAVGKKFDHKCHEALMTAESLDHDDHTVLEVFQKGYMLGERVIRTAKVKVSKRPVQGQAEEKVELNENNPD